MRRMWFAGACALSLVLALTSAVAAIAEPDRGDGRATLDVYVGELTPEQFEALRSLGVDADDVATSAGSNGRIKVETILSQQQVNRLKSKGLPLAPKTIRGSKTADVMRAQLVAGETVYRSYSEPGGIRDEIVKAAADHPQIAKLVPIGKSVNNQTIYAVKVTKFAKLLPDGTRPAVLYAAAQHAREWITPEMVRRLMHTVLDGYGSNPELTNLVNTRELWFLPVANPDGYDFTFTEGNRLWRKNLRDNNGDGEITSGDGVDPNRNFAYKWGYDNEGSSPDPSSETYRGTGPNSEPETKALDGLFKRIRFKFFVNYHSAAELLLYGVGWQVSTPTPDDEIYKAMVGDDANPAVPGYDPDISAELYTTNGDTDTHATALYKILGFTPEMTTCEVVSASIPDDEWLPEDCVSGFNFPDDEELIQAEFAKNVPFALAVAKSAGDPDDPVSVVGLTAPDFAVDAFDVSYGTTQNAAVIAKRALLNLRMRYKVNGGSTRTAFVSEWKGGERYGDTHDDYYAEYRGKVTGTKAGDSVEVWFTGVKPGTGPVSSAHFTYKVHTDIGGKVLILAVEDVTGISPGQGLTAAQFTDEYAASLTAAGLTSDVYDFDVMGRKAPHHLGVLSHYKAVVWETGNDIIPRAVGQVGGTTAKVAPEIELNVRDYLNEGGKLLLTGKYARFAPSADGAYFYNPFAPPECTTPGVYPCLPVLNDFGQYYLGAYNYVDGGGTDPDGNPFPLSGTAGDFAGFAGDLNAPGSAANQNHTASFLSTESFLPAAQFPQFGGSSAPVDWVRPGGAPFDPRTGDWYVYSGRSDISFKRLTRTVDLTAASSGELNFWTSYDTEADWDFLFVEAHEVGSPIWTTLPDANGHTDTSTGESCPAGWHDLHPFLENYQGADCSGAGTTGTWNAASGASGGWVNWSVDLSAYAGKQVEISISYVSDWSVQGLGVFVDDVTVTAGAGVSTTSFEAGLDGWTIAGPAPGSDPSSTDWARSQLAFEEGAVVTTKDTVYTGFGLEGLAPAARDDFVARVMEHLLG